MDRTYDLYDESRMGDRGKECLFLPSCQLGLLRKDFQVTQKIYPSSI